jgi:hypothetical protein
MNDSLPVVSATTSALAAKLTKNKVTQTTGGGGSFLKFAAKANSWVAGSANEVCTDEIVAIDLTTLKHGWALWHARKCDRKMVDISVDLPEAQEPISYTDNKGKPQVDEAAEARAFNGKFMEDGSPFQFETSSFGGRGAVDAILEPVFERAGSGNPFMFPVVKLSSESYEHGSYGEIHNPVLEVMYWADENGTREDDPDQLGGPDSEPAPEAAPEEEEPAPVAAAPTKRRRRPAPATA